ISYSWDNESHKDWVREFAEALASNGIDIILDQYDLRIGEDRFQFMEASVRDADTVLCICTPSYVTKANGRASGVGVETSLITPQFYERMSSSKKFIPVVRSSEESIPPTPDYLAALIFLDFRDDSQFDSQLEELLRHLYNQPKYRKPTVGVRPTFQDASREVKWEGDGYWTVREDGAKDGPFCQVCYDSSKKLCRLYHGSEPDPDYESVTRYYLKCRVCSSVFEDHDVGR
ncbi:MAG: toll/interleukin-1 receptor domain-containing protein, partial [bacterium]